MKDKSQSVVQGMATARDTLFEELVKLLKSDYSATSSGTLLAVLERFRIQAKSGPNSTMGTAREMICGQLIKAWKEMSAAELPQAISRVIGHYRMQLKQGDNKKPDAKERITKLVSKIQVPKSQSEPLAGGPQKRQKVRGECPKCHSIGVVLARSYSGDEYFSCIYCGYQSHRASMDLEFDLPLAAELLNRRFDDKEGH